jgi:ABC-type glycerol-3-phosphate transport system substrate-binding protein
MVGGRLALADSPGSYCANKDDGGIIMTSWKAAALALASCLLLGACSQDVTGGESARSPSASSPAATLALTCTGVQKAIVTLGADPKAPVLEGVRKQVAALSR